MESPVENQDQESKRTNRTWLVIVVVAIILFSLGIFVIDRQNKSPKNTQNAAMNAPQPTLPKEVMVILSDKGFTPQTVRIQAGSVVRWRNESDAKASVNSDDHPTNKKYPELNLGEFTNGFTLMHIFNKAGTYTYHNYFKPTQKGTIIVQ